MMSPVADFTGLNRLTRHILANAANAMAGMCSLPTPTATAGDQRPLLAATMFGVTTRCVNRVRELLEAEGFELLVFHATGAGGQAMEQLIRDGFIRGVLDITTSRKLLLKPSAAPLLPPGLPRAADGPVLRRALAAISLTWGFPPPRG